MPKILSIQSHVVHGYVGNKAVTFPLQYKGWDVDCLNTVQFSNHPAYGSFQGFKYDPENLYEIMARGLLDFLQIDYDCILIGYFPSVDGLNKISDLLASRQTGASNSSENPQPPLPKIVVDPVLGDNGQLYVAPEMVQVYRSFLQKVDIFCCTPNQFELETLTGIKIDSLNNLRKAMFKFHELYPLVKKLVVTSCVNIVAEDPSTIINASYDFSANELYYIESPLLDCSFSGCGDLYTALLTNELLTTKKTLKDAMNYVVSTIYHMLHLTKKLHLEDLESENIQPVYRNHRMVINDLKLIESRVFLDNNFQPDKLFDLLT
ncbi:hypothetical protein ACO0QE_003770 [Hanseniaspora vineae]